MTIAGLNQADFLEILKLNGYEELSNTYWDLEGVERIVLGKDGHTFAFRLKSFYYHNEVVKRCQMLEIVNIPEALQDQYNSCLTATTQLAELKLKSQPKG